MLRPTIKRSQTVGRELYCSPLEDDKRKDGGVNETPLLAHVEGVKTTITSVAQAMWTIRNRKIVSKIQNLNSSNSKDPVPFFYLYCTKVSLSFHRISYFMVLRGITRNYTATTSNFSHSLLVKLEREI